MAKASTPGTESKAKRLTTRKPAGKAAAVAKPKETGADAPVSSTTPPAATDQPTPPVGADGAAPPAPAELSAPGPQAPAPADPADTPAESEAGPAADTSEPPARTGIDSVPEDEEQEPKDGEQVQTPDQEGVGQAVQSPAWELPGITEFPAELTLVNNTRHLLIVRPLCVRVGRFGELKVVCPTARHYDAIKRDFSGRAVRERWNSQTGLQVVTHDDDQN